MDGRSLNQLVFEAHKNSVEHGFWDNESPDDIHVVSTKLALIHSEVSEALEAIREGLWDIDYRADGKPEGLPSELADIVIRVFDLAGARKIDLAHAIIEKMAFNAGRERKHGKAI